MWTALVPPECLMADNDNDKATVTPQARLDLKGTFEVFIFFYVILRESRGVRKRERETQKTVMPFLTYSLSCFQS